MDAFLKPGLFRVRRSVIKNAQGFHYEGASILYRHLWILLFCGGAPPAHFQVPVADPRYWQQIRQTNSKYQGLLGQ